MPSFSTALNATHSTSHSTTSAIHHFKHSPATTCKAPHAHNLPPTLIPNASSTLPQPFSHSSHLPAIPFHIPPDPTHSLSSPSKFHSTSQLLSPPRITAHSSFLSPPEKLSLSIYTSTHNRPSQNITTHTQHTLYHLTQHSTSPSHPAQHFTFTLTDCSHTALPPLHKPSQPSPLHNTSPSHPRHIHLHAQHPCISHSTQHLTHFLHPKLHTAHTRHFITLTQQPIIFIRQQSFFTPTKPQHLQLHSTFALHFTAPSQHLHIIS